MIFLLCWALLMKFSSLLTICLLCWAFFFTDERFSALANSFSSLLCIFILCRVVFLCRAGFLLWRTLFFLNLLSREENLLAREENLLGREQKCTTEKKSPRQRRKMHDRDTWKTTRQRRKMHDRDTWKTTRQRRKILGTEVKFGRAGVRTELSIVFVGHRTSQQGPPLRIQNTVCRGLAHYDI